MPNAPGYGGWDSFGTFSKAQQAEYEKWYKEQFPKQYQIYEPGEQVFAAPDGYDNHVHHFANFFSGMREGTSIVEDGSFGLRAAAPALAANMSQATGKVINWDPVKMELK